jgi:hypothetical protein
MIGEEQNRNGSANELDNLQNLDSIPLPLNQVPWKLIISGLTIGTAFASAPFAVLYLLSLLSSNSGFVTYTDTNSSIKVDIPFNWEVRRINNSFIGDVVQFISPNFQGDKFREAVTISIEKFSGTFNQYTQLEVQDIRQHIKSASITANHTSTLAQRKASELVYTVKEGNKTTKYWKKSTLYNKQVYTITYAASVVDYNKYFPTVQHMAQTFEIKGDIKGDAKGK